MTNLRPKTGGAQSKTLPAARCLVHLTRLSAFLLLPLPQNLEWIQARVLHTGYSIRASLLQGGNSGENFFESGE